MPNLTDAEWQIMRALWDQHPASASQIATAMKTSKDWSITTVKTFLARLVQKDLIRFDEEGKKFLYSPLVTEHECVTGEMKQVIHRLYGGAVLHQSPRFEFYGVDNRPLIERLATHLETEAARLEKRYHATFSSRQQVYLYPTINRLHSALGRLFAPDWLRAGWVWDIIHLAPEEVFDNLSIEAAATQVWMEKVLFSINPFAPYWLTQGIRTVESRVLTQERLQSAMAEELPSLNIHTVKRLGAAYDLFKIHHGYELSATVIEYIAANYTWDAVLAFVKKPEDYQGSFGCDESEFWHGWMSYVQHRYAKKEGE